MMTRPDLAGWLFRSPRRLLAAAAALFLISAGAVWLAHTTSEADEQLPAAVIARPDPPAPHPHVDASQLTAAIVDGHPDAAHPGGREAVRRTAASYLRVFLSDTGTRAAWQARLDRLSTDTLARLNATVPRSRVPDAMLRRLRVAVMSSSYAGARAVLSDGTRLTVALVLEADGWRVTEVASEPGR
jgi:hypothetical protein